MPLRDHPLPTGLRSFTYGRIIPTQLGIITAEWSQVGRVDDSGVGLLARLNPRDAVRQTKAAPFRCLSGGGSVITFVESSSCSSWMSLSARKIARASAIWAWSAMRSRFRKRSRPLDFSRRASARPGIRRLWGLTALVRNMRPASGQNRPPVIGNLCFRDASAQFTIKVDQAGKRHQRGMKLVPDTHVVIEFVGYLTEVIIGVGRHIGIAEYRQGLTERAGIVLGINNCCKRQTAPSIG